MTPAGRDAAAVAERILSEPPPALRALTNERLGQLTDLLSRQLAAPGQLSSRRKPTFRPTW